MESLDPLANDVGSDETDKGADAGEEEAAEEEEEDDGPGEETCDNDPDPGSAAPLGTFRLPT